MRNATLWLNPRSTSHTSWANLFEVHACRVWSRMVALPISVAVNVYRGKNQQQMRVVQERIRLARAIEQYVNSQSLGSSSVTLLTYAQIAGAVGGQIQQHGAARTAASARTGAKARLRHPGALVVARAGARLEARRLPRLGRASHAGRRHAVERGFATARLAAGHRLPARAAGTVKLRCTAFAGWGEAKVWHE